MRLNTLARSTAHKTARRLGIDVHRFPSHDMDADFVRLWTRVRPYTATSPERLLALRDSIRYVVDSDIPGAIVECGVWRGGSMMAAAITLLGAGSSDRPLYLFDTFSGMTLPTANDMRVDGAHATDLLAGAPRRRLSAWMIASLEEVQANMATTGYPIDLVNYVVGAVEETIPASAPERIALLRLDTDWYRSTRHEMEHLFPRLSRGAVLIVDDYGQWQGARKAIDEYFRENDVHLYLGRIDDSGRLAVIR